MQRQVNLAFFQSTAPFRKQCHLNFGRKLKAELSCYKVLHCQLCSSSCVAVVVRPALTLFSYDSCLIIALSGRLTIICTSWKCKRKLTTWSSQLEHCTCTVAVCTLIYNMPARISSVFAMFESCSWSASVTRTASQLLKVPCIQALNLQPDFQ